MAKLCDFGVSEKIDKGDILSKTAGTYHFFPPECCDPEVEQYSGKAADIWALGITLFCLMYNQLPFWDHDNCENEYSVLELILKNDVVIPTHIERSQGLQELLLQMLEKDPSKRISME